MPPTLPLHPWSCLILPAAFPDNQGDSFVELLGYTTSGVHTSGAHQPCRRMAQVTSELQTAQNGRCIITAVPAPAKLLTHDTILHSVEDFPPCSVSEGAEAQRHQREAVLARQVQLKDPAPSSQFQAGQKTSSKMAFSRDTVLLSL